jgi:hypothetical protein
MAKQSSTPTKKVKETPEMTEALDAIENLMGAFNTPLRRLKFPGIFQDEVIDFARNVLKKHGRGNHV